MLQDQQPVGHPPLSWNPMLHSGVDQPLRAKSFGSTSHPVGIPLSQPHLLPIPHQVHPGVSTSSSVVWPESPSVNTPSPITVASELVGCTSTPQPIGPPPLMHLLHQPHKLIFKQCRISLHRSFFPLHNPVHSGHHH